MNTVADFVVTSELVQPVVNTINSSLSTLVPIGIAVMATFIGIGLIQK